MAFSILPMAVGASFTGVTPTAQRTGSLWEAQGVATNVRHWGDGVLVAREDITRVITGRTGLAPAPTGNLRHIMVAADYFVGATGAAATQASLLVQLQNAASFAIASHGDAEMRALQVEDAMPGLLNWLNTPNPPTILPITPRARNDLWPGTWELPGNITQNTTPGSINTVPSLPPAAAFPGDVALTGSGTEDSPLTRGRRIIADAQAAVVYDQGNSWTWAMPFEVATQWGTGATWSTDTIIWLTLNGNLVRAQDGTDIEYLTIPSGIETLAGETINTRNARLFNPLSVASNTGAWDFDLEALVPAPPTVLAATAPVGITTPNMSSLMPFQSDILQVIGNDAQNVIAFNIINVGPTGVAGGSLDGQDAFFVAALVRSATAGHRAFTPGNNQAFLYIWRTPNFPMTPEGVHVGSHFIGLPIEFVTNSDTNSGPVHLLFTHHGGWAQAGQAAFRTDITAVTEATFQITRNGGPRNFHRYGTVLVGGTGRTDGIRIREGAQGAFDQTEWFVEIEIITPGFFWTAFSEDVLRNQNNRPIPNWQGAPAITTRYTVGGAHLGPDGASNITVHDVRRGPDGAASVTNRWNTLYFGITIPNATNLNRLVNDEINIRGLHIGADDRARAGIVEA
ncbi:MAG: hypothetical protein FWG68_07995, partial [Defluviitaleaceae bacterium]|nr:hypothetical protein [Defluviitaleaceae bacterium]